MEEKIKKMYHQDVFITTASVLILLLVLSYVLFSLNLILPEISLKIPVLAVGFAVGCYAVMIIVAVVNHLKNHKKDLYTEELKYSMPDQY